MKYISIIFAAAYLFTGAYGFAHESGASFEASVGDYLVDIGYDESPAAGEAVRFDLRLYKKGEEQPFESAWVRIAEENRLLFAGPIHGSESVRPGLSVTFDRAGTYDVFVRYEGTAPLAEASFALEVGVGRVSADPLPWTLAALAGGSLLGFFISRWLKR